MEQFIKEWWGFGVVFIVASMVFLKLLTISGDAWKSGDWKSAIWRTVGPVVSLIFLCTVGAAAVSISFTNTYNTVKNSIPAQGLVALGSGVTSLIAGSLESAPEIAVPETSSIVEVIQNASEAIAPQTNAPASAPSSAPVNNVESAAPAPVQSSVSPAVKELSNEAPSGTGSFSQHPDYKATEAAYTNAKPAAPVATLVPRNLSASEVEGIPNASNPNLIGPGVTKDDGGGPQTYTVKPNDSMAKIAKAVGLPDYRAICAANRAIVGNDCNVIRSGQVLVIP